MTKEDFFNEVNVIIEQCKLKLQIFQETLKEFYLEEDLDIFFQNELNLLNLADEIYNNSSEIRDFKSSVSYNFKFMTVIIRFKEITLKNSNNRIHKIHNLFVKFHVSYYGNFINEIEGLRTTLTEEEASSFYRHSHLSSHSEGYFSHFCLGTGPIATLKQFIASIDDDFEEEDYRNDIRLFLHNLNEYLSWESLEGGPYRKISNMIEKSSSRLITEYDKEDYELFKNFIIETIKDDKITEFIDINIDADFVDYNLQILDNELSLSYAKFVIDKYLKEEIDENYLLRNICTKNNNGNFCGLEQFLLIDTDVKKLITSKKTLFTFKGEKQHLEIIKKEKNKFIINPNLTYHANPEFIRQFLSEFKKSIPLKLFSKEYNSGYWKKNYYKNN